MEDLLRLVDEITVKPLVNSTRKSSGLNYPTSCSVQYEENGEKVTVGSCLRKLWYERKGFPVVSDNTAESIDRMNIGEWFSDNLVERFKQLGLYVADEVSFWDPVTEISGRIDIMIKDPFKAPKPPNRPQPSQLIGIEVKSTGGYHNVKGVITSTKDTPLMPKLEHVLQVMPYLSYYQPYDLDTWIIIYQDRESLKKQWHKVTLNEAGSPVITNLQQSITLNKITIQGIRDRFTTLKAHLVGDTLPDRDYELQYSNTYIKKLFDTNKLGKTDSDTVERKLKKYSGKNLNDKDVVLLEKGDNECGYCAFKEVCWSESPAKMPIVAPERPLVRQEVKQEEVVDLV